VEPGVDLIYGAGKLDRRVEDVEALLRARTREADWSQLYLELQPSTPQDVLRRAARVGERPLT
jgi:hypothetical protein